MPISQRELIAIHTAPEQTQLTFNLHQYYGNLSNYLTLTFAFCDDEYASKNLTQTLLQELLGVLQLHTKKRAGSSIGSVEPHHIPQVLDIFIKLKQTQKLKLYVTHDTNFQEIMNYLLSRHLIDAAQHTHYNNEIRVLPSLKNMEDEVRVNKNFEQALTLAKIYKETFNKKYPPEAGTKVRFRELDNFINKALKYCMLALEYKPENINFKECIDLQWFFHQFEQLNWTVLTKHFSAIAPEIEKSKTIKTFVLSPSYCNEDFVNFIVNTKIIKKLHLNSQSEPISKDALNNIATALKNNTSINTLAFSHLDEIEVLLEKLSTTINSRIKHLDLTNVFLSAKAQKILIQYIENNVFIETVKLPWFATKETAREVEKLLAENKSVREPALTNAILKSSTDSFVTHFNFPQDIATELAKYLSYNDAAKLGLLCKASLFATQKNYQEAVNTLINTKINRNQK